MKKKLSRKGSVRKFNSFDASKTGSIFKKTGTRGSKFKKKGNVSIKRKTGLPRNVNQYRAIIDQSNEAQVNWVLGLRSDNNDLKKRLKK